MPGKLVALDFPFFCESFYFTPVVKGALMIFNIFCLFLVQISSVGSPVSKQQSVVSGGPMVTTASTIVTTSTTTSHRDIVPTPVVGRSHSPRGHSPSRERDSYRWVNKI